MANAHIHTYTHAHVHAHTHVQTQTHADPQTHTDMLYVWVAFSNHKHVLAPRMHAHTHTMKPCDMSTSWEKTDEWKAFLGDKPTIPGF